MWHKPPTREELAALARLLGSPEPLLSRRSTRFRELQPDQEQLQGDRLLDLLAAEPKLLRRPIITDGRRVVVGYDEAALAAMFGA
ncbi:MAG: arsenate reductase [Symbiobacteriaceae bacterium]